MQNIIGRRFVSSFQFSLVIVAIISFTLTIATPENYGTIGNTLYDAESPDGLFGNR